LKCKECRTELPNYSGHGPVPSYCSDRCRKRASRRRASEGVGHRPDDVPADLPTQEPGRVRQGLEDWLVGRDGFDEAPSALVEAARVLADQVDGEPRNSPLWGRYTQLLETLVTPQVQGREVAAELGEILSEVALAGADEEWRAAKYQEAVARGDDPSGWEKVVPISCVRGQHSWRRPDYWGIRRCEYCDTASEAAQEGRENVRP
jgi:hypothetical protein